MSKQGEETGRCLRNRDDREWKGKSPGGYEGVERRTLEAGRGRERKGEGKKGIKKLKKKEKKQNKGKRKVRIKMKAYMGVKRDGSGN